MSDTTTDGIRVQVTPAFWPERSSIDAEQWAFTYRIVITNIGQAPATLKHRHWIITDGTGRIEEVRGEGVVGKCPRLEPGESFEYSSWVMLKTPFGTMRGEYFMERSRTHRFAAHIGEFVLAMPNSLN